MESRRFVLLLLLVLIDAVSSATFLQKISSLYFDEGYNHLFGEDNLMVQSDGRTVHLSLDRETGAGFVSHDLYQYGFFSASIKLPADYTAGVVVAFYMSNGDVFENNHDEIDFEFLGNIRGKDWRVQTNIYGNGSTATGREERYGLWFDPSEEFHNYSILWTDTHVVFYVDDVPIREVKRVSMVADYPTKCMSLYTTIWDGSDWATSGGRYKVNYKLAPYAAKFKDLVLHGCSVDPMNLHHSSCDFDSVDFPVGFSPKERSDMESFREKHMTYSNCYDRLRYPSPPAECTVEPELLPSLGMQVLLNLAGNTINGDNDTLNMLPVAEEAIDPSNAFVRGGYDFICGLDLWILNSFASVFFIILVSSREEKFVVGGGAFCVVGSGSASSF